MKIGIVGYGNLGWHWARLLSKDPSDEIYVYARNKNSREALDHIHWSDSLQSLTESCAIIILAVRDSSISEVSKLLAPHISDDTLVIHNSGTTPLDALSGIKRKAVIWPMMTIKRNIEIDWSSCPLFLQYGEEKDRQVVRDFACRISENIYEFNDKAREYYHLSAVWANNFVNHMMTKAFQLLQEQNLDPQVLLPMLKTHLQYLEIYKNPRALQTGPAQRKDWLTMERHQKLMDEQTQKLYQTLSEDIIKTIER